MAELGWYDKAWDCMDNEDYAQAKEYFEKALEEGETEAYCNLGNLYFFGNGVEQDYRRAFEYYQKGAKAGEPYCMENLGTCYFWGHGVDTDIQNAAFYNEKAAKAGVEKAMYDTGLNYERGYGVSQNIDKALYWLEKAAEEEYLAAFMELGNLYFNGEYVEKDLEKAFQYYCKGAELGDQAAKLSLAKFYEEGLVVEKNLKKAKALYQEAYDLYYEKAVTEDDKEAQSRLGDFYFKGMPLIGLDKDYTQAAEWFEKSAKNGLDHAQNNLGIMYAFGIGVGQNYEKAFYWYSLAAERMNLEAMSNVANCYCLGRGVEQNYDKAVEYHTKAANLGYANSQEVLGEMYMKGDGVEQNYTKAAYWLKKSCENGERSAYGLLGDCYRKGLGLDKDVKKAFELYQKGADMGDLQSKVSLAESLIEGWGTTVDYEKAYQILLSVCSDEEDYRKNLVTMDIYEYENGRMFLRNPLDEEEMPHYAKAYYLLGTLYHSGKGSDGANPTKAIVMLRTADKLGYEGDGIPPQELIEKIVGKSKKAEVQNAIDCYVEVRECETKERLYNVKRGRGQKMKHEIYDVVLHHADGTESVVNFMGRNQFFYILALMIAHEGKRVAGLTSKHFTIMRKKLGELAEDSHVDTNGYKEWIDEFIYSATKQNREISLNSYKYSNALSGANRAIKNSCTDDEYEIFQLRSTGGRYAVTTIALETSQIRLPNSIKKYLKDLPNEEQIVNYTPRQNFKDINE